MKYDRIKKRTAPCGLHCGKCFAFREGDIGKHAKSLKKLLGNFEVYAERFVNLLDEPVFKSYSEFNNMLKYLASPQCSGCREERCKLFKDCKVRGCAEKKGFDFCFECPDFPCEDTGFDTHLHKRSVMINKRMEKIGVENYYNEIKDEPRY